jgi:hypothetical protein
LVHVLGAEGIFGLVAHNVSLPRSWAGGISITLDMQFWIEQIGASEENCDKEEDTGQLSTGVEILLTMSHNTLTRAEEYI